MPSPTHARITAGELAVVLSNYPIGVIDSVRRFKGGSRQSPKVLVEARTGRYLLKRRPAPLKGADTAQEARKVAFTHEVVLHLAKHGFPVPELIGTGGANNSMLEMATGVYELHRFIDGTRYARQNEQAWAAGWWLARCHELLRDLSTQVPAPHRSFHAHPKIPARLAQIADMLGGADTLATCQALTDAYVQAAERATACGAGDHAQQIVHGDWHPGNMLFRGVAEAVNHVPPRALRAAGLVAGVFDFDSARRGVPLHDLANGAMQFAVHRFVGADGSGSGAPVAEGTSGSDAGGGGGGGASSGSRAGAMWRIALDPHLLQAFFTGYAAHAGPLDVESRKAVPWLMIQALVVEVAVPIGATGTFGKLAALPVLSLVQRAVEAMANTSDRLVALTAEPTM